jgi:hypothetical protein
VGQFSTGGVGQFYSGANRSQTLAVDLHDRGHLVSIVNPARIKAFGQSEGIRTKTDAVDAAVIARFCQLQRPVAWTPPKPAVRALQALVRRRQSLVEIRTQELNRMQGPEGNAAVAQSIQELLAHLDRQIQAIDEQIEQSVDDNPTLHAQRELLESIPGIARRTATTILGECPDLAEFQRADFQPPYKKRWRARARTTQPPGSANSSLKLSLAVPAVPERRFGDAQLSRDLGDPRADFGLAYCRGDLLVGVAGLAHGANLLSVGVRRHFPAIRGLRSWEKTRPAIGTAVHFF